PKLFLWGVVVRMDPGVSVGSGDPHHVVVPIQHEAVQHPRVLQLPPALARAAQSILQEEGMGTQSEVHNMGLLWGLCEVVVGLCGSPCPLSPITVPVGSLWVPVPLQPHNFPYRYTAELARAYLAVRLERDHAAVGRALREIQLRVPAFTPQTMLDFGSGIGTACWVAHELWGHSLRQYLCVGSSRAMREMGERLRHGDGGQGGNGVRGVMGVMGLMGSRGEWEVMRAMGCNGRGVA
uniref:Methyltransferase like 17 n=1 Tax=Pavo cristatus TaxID=9049 RepID=A0A8C9EYB8_PAVCR